MASRGLSVISYSVTEHYTRPCAIVKSHKNGSRLRGKEGKAIWSTEMTGSRGHRPTTAPSAAAVCASVCSSEINTALDLYQVKKALRGCHRYTHSTCIYVHLMKVK